MNRIIRPGLEIFKMSTVRKIRKTIRLKNMVILRFLVNEKICGLKYFLSINSLRISKNIFSENHLII